MNLNFLVSFFQRWSFSGFDSVKSEEHKQCLLFVAQIRQATIEDRFPAIWFHIPNEFAGKKRKYWGALMAGLGRFPGLPDYVVMWKGGGVLLEFKTEKGRQSPNQKIIQKWADEIGVEYHIVCSHHDAIQYLVEKGIYIV